MHVLGLGHGLGRGYGLWNILLRVSCCGLVGVVGWLWWGRKGGLDGGRVILLMWLLLLLMLMLLLLLLMLLLLLLLLLALPL